MKKIFIDVETTGLNPDKHSIWSISAILDINSNTKEIFNERMCPKDGFEYSEEAMKLNNLTIDILKSYPSQKDVFCLFLNFLSSHIDKYDTNDKAFFYAYNSKFDYDFVRKWFESNDDKYFGSWFFSPHIDIMTLAAEYLLNKRNLMPNFQLSTVAKELKINFYSEKLHSSLEDIKIAREIYYKVK